MVEEEAVVAVKAAAAAVKAVVAVVESPRPVVGHLAHRVQASTLAVNPNPHPHTVVVEHRQAPYLRGYRLQGGLQVVVRVIRYMAQGEFITGGKKRAAALN